MITSKIFKENDLVEYKDKAKVDLVKLWQNDHNELARIVLAKRNHNLYGDVYLLSNGTIQDLATHKGGAFPDSVVTTIEEAAAEAVAKANEPVSE